MNLGPPKSSAIPELSLWIIVEVLSIVGFFVFYFSDRGATNSPGRGSPVEHR